MPETVEREAPPDPVRSPDGTSRTGTRRAPNRSDGGVPGAVHSFLTGARDLPAGLWRLRAWLPLALLGLVLWAPHLREWWKTSQKDDLISHAPLLFAIAGVHLWLFRNRMRRWDSADPRGLVLLAASCLLMVASYFADVTFFKFFSLIGITAGVFWYLGGWDTFKAAMGPLGFLFFVLPWPSALVEKVSFPLQLMSSAYAALLGGIVGLPIHREGVQLMVVPHPNAPPTYSVIVAQACSGLTSLLVLLALGYLVALHTPISKRGRLLLVASMVPLALVTNTLRLTFILLAGANHSRELAQWVHDHEAPFLVFLSSFAIVGLRKAFVAWEEGKARRNPPAIPLDDQAETAAPAAVKPLPEERERAGV